ncbi:MAG: sigma-54 dependent transcriptional regulator [Aestuariivita sp.]|nr:sigma-54 dependent transcriptional regulator [Aestuariivita sp.]MCY4347068.1 sigma-54 dependent transcriptional regulator [Aestuariivita sp.]
MNDILIVDDERDIRELVADILKDEGFSTRLAGTSKDAMAQIKEKIPSLLILDIWLKDRQMDGIDILKAVKRDIPNIPVVIISGHGNVEIAVAAIKQGAYDFIEKPFNIDQLLVVIRRAMETSLLRSENRSLRHNEVNDSKMLGNSNSFRSLINQLDKITRTNSRVLLTGPAGCGKGMAAKYIHTNSSRFNARFVTVSCMGVESDRLEESLFGNESAERGINPGLFEKAHGGTIYFDEVADLPLDLQLKVLRVLVDGQLQRPGGTDMIPIDVRVVSSTQRDISAEVEHNRFRGELYHRLSVVPISVPSLEERREDIPMLAEHFIEMARQSQGLVQRHLSADAKTQMQTMSWPGNVRQLRNLIERLLILGDESAPIESRELLSEVSGSSKGSEFILSDEMALLPLRQAREVFERQYLLTQVNRFRGNISRTAAFIGMERSALHRKLKSLGVPTSGKGAEQTDQVTGGDSA